MAPEDAPPKDHPAEKSSLKPNRHSGRLPKKRSSRRKTGPAAPDADHACLIIGEQGSCAEWQGLLAQYPMIDSVQREDFPDHDASFVYLAHFYRTGNTALESSCAQKQFEDFFQAIGYTHDSAGNFESRWFEGIGVRIR